MCSSIERGVTAGVVDLLLAASLLAGCFDPSVAECAFLCESEGVCPLNLTCGADHYCHRPGDAIRCASPDGGSDASTALAFTDPVVTPVSDTAILSLAVADFDLDGNLDV